jgi:hypothetical protein
MMQQRPTSLTIIGWFLIVIAAFGLISQVTMQDNPVAQQVLAQSPLPAWVHMALGVVGAVVTAACGYGVLKGLNWSRYLYVGYSLFGLAIGFLTTPFTSIWLISLLFLAVFAFFLFRPAANAWFTGDAAIAGE